MAVELWFVVLYASYNGAMVVFLTEFMPVEVRATGFSLAYSLATAIFGGFTPAICTCSDPRHGESRDAGRVALVCGSHGVGRHAAASTRGSRGQMAERERIETMTMAGVR